MSRKIIGVTVGSPLPKPNLMQADPNKGDYVNGKEEFLVQFESELDEGINTALAIAKESGEFDGKDGYTPVKGVDYTDGKDGRDGLCMFCSERDRMDLDDYLALADIVVPSGYTIGIGDLILMPKGDVERVTEFVNQVDGATEVRTESTGINLKGKDGEDGDGGGDVMIVTANGNTASHSASQISSHVKSGGTAIFKSGESIYSYAGNDDGADSAMFLAINGYDAELGACFIEGNLISYYTYEFANDFVPNTRKVNNKSLSADISLTAADVGAVAISDLNASGLGITNARKFNTFADIPNGNGLLHCYVQVGSTPDQDCPYPTDVTMWWDVLQFGHSTRQTQIAVQTYSSRPGKDEVWCRTKHDSTLSKWTRINVVGDLVTAVPRGGKFEIIKADHKWLTSYRDSTVPNIPVASNYTHIVSSDSDGTIKAVLSIPWDYTDTMYQYSGKSKKWFAIATTDYVDAKCLTVTVTNNKPSHTSEQIRDHVLGGGSVTLKYGSNTYNFVAYDDNLEEATFLNVDNMDGEYIESIAVSGATVSYKRFSFATKADLDQKVSNPNSAKVGQTIVVKSVDEDGIPTEWEAVDLPSGGGDGSSTLIVTVSGDKTSHTAKQIINHVKSGGMAVLKFLGGEGDRVCNFVSCDEEEERVTFIGVSYTEGSQYSECVVYGSTVENRMLKSVDDILTEGGEIFPTTHYEGTGEEGSTGDGWEWNGMEGGLWFNIEEPLVKGKTYSVTIDGERYTAVAEEGMYVDDCQTLDLIVSEKFLIYYFVDEEYVEGFNAVIWPTWKENEDAEWGEDGMLMPSFSFGIEAPTTIKNEYLDMGAIVAAVKAELDM